MAKLLAAQPANFLKTFSATTTYSGSVPGNYVLQHTLTQGIATLSPSSFILSGSYERGPMVWYDTMLADGYLVKNQTNGLTKWFRKYHLAKRSMRLFDVAIKYNSEIIAGGTSYNLSSQENPDGILLTTDSNGHLKSVKLYPKQRISRIIVMKDKKVAILALDSNRYAKLVLLDKDCNVLWSKNLSHQDLNCCRYFGYKL
ncbi:MAG: hypothetical protein V4635_00780 [Bacteroidota bacterium]